jgi:prepilin-type N-terminal cleavage/methylation domain-containing protein/prepilin-type processing-associated H-X9-DG protein
MPSDLTTRPKSSPAASLLKGSRRGRAFTLVELLVVIGIIALLISILLPVLSKVRKHSQEVTCRANLHSIGQAFFQYANTYRDRLPNSNPPRMWYNPSTSGAVLPFFAKDFLPSPASFHCPADRDPVPALIDNGDIGSDNSARVSYDFYSIYWPADLGPLLTRLRGQAPLAWDLDGGNPKSPLHNPHTADGGNVLYADGHVAWLDNTSDNWGDKATKQANWPKPASDFYPNATDVWLK